MRCVWFERGKVIVEDERARVLRIVDTTSAGISGAQVALRVITRQRLDGHFFHLALPRALRAVRRNQYPFLCQRIESPVRIPLQIKAHFSSVFHARLPAPSVADEI